MGASLMTEEAKGASNIGMSISPKSNSSFLAIKRNQNSLTEENE
jgi:hypothetical protein